MMIHIRKLLVFSVGAALWLPLPTLIARPEQPDRKPMAVEAKTEQQAAQAIILEGLPNLHKVSPFLYRGAQPSEAGFAQLKKLGVKTVINLRAFHSDRDLIAKTGLNYEDISFKTWHPEEEDIVRFLQIVGNTNNAPFFVHCQHGADRTGVMCAIYRMVIGGWDRAAAIREMTEGGFGFHPIWSNLVTFLQELDVEAIRRKAFPPAVSSQGNQPSTIDPGLCRWDAMRKRWDSRMPRRRLSLTS